MARIPDFEQEITDDLKRLGHLFHPRHASATAVAAAVNIRTTTPGGPVSSFFADIKAKAHTFVDDLEQIDENAISAVEAIKVNPTGVSIVNTVASIAHLPDPQGLLSGADAFLKVLAAGIASAAAATAPDVQAAPAGPAVAGQA
jgi:hypothetical protein